MSELLAIAIITCRGKDKSYISSKIAKLRQKYPKSVTADDDNDAIRFDANLEDPIRQSLEASGCSMTIVEKVPKNIITTASNNNRFDARYTE